jgi:hypothetical protein
MTLLAHLKPLGELKPDILYVVIFHANRKPPHIGIVWNQLYFSSTVKGSEVAIPFGSKQEVINKRKIPCILLGLKKPEMPLIVLNELMKVFNERTSISTSNTCLSPITVFLNKLYQLKPSAPLLHGLIEALQKRSLIEETFSIHLKPDVNDSFELPEYDAEMVSMRISRLLHHEKYGAI